MNTYKEVRDAIELLSKEFNVPVPLIVESRGRTSVAYFGSGGSAPRPAKKLHISRNDWHGLEQATLHEFTHAVRCFRVGHHGHDYEFFRALCDVIRAWKGDVKAYAWDKEYHTVWSFAFGLGYTNQPHWKQKRRMDTGMLRTSLVRTAANNPGAFVEPGMTVAWSSRRFGDQRGVVLSARAGCRAKIRTTTGQLFYVPQSWLKEVR